eukprot:1504321-Lingulodinium_polyedra.AAC.1
MAGTKARGHGHGDGAAACRDAGAAMDAFNSAANQWLAERTGAACPPDGAEPARWRRPAPPQSGPD